MYTYLIYIATLNNTVIDSMQSITSMTLLTLNNIHTSYCKSSNALLSYSSETHVSWFTHHNCKYVCIIKKMRHLIKTFLVINFPSSWLLLGNLHVNTISSYMYVAVSIIVTQLHIIIINTTIYLHTVDLVKLKL